jgi:hypothetical protein
VASGVGQNRTTISNSGAAWRNPGGGFGSGCTSWDAGHSPANISPTEPDQMFHNSGSRRRAWRNPDTFTQSVCELCVSASEAGASYLGTDDTGNHTDDGFHASSPCHSLTICMTIPSTPYRSAQNGHLAFGIPLSNFNVSCIPVLGATYTIGPYWTDQCTGPCQWGEWNVVWHFSPLLVDGGA